MKIVKVIDQHPGKWQDNMELVLCNVTRYNCDNSIIGKFMSGVRPNTQDCRGMFSEDHDPIQQVIEVNGEYLFTMSNCTDISREEVDELLRNKSVEVIRKFENGYVYFHILIEVIE